MTSGAALAEKLVSELRRARIRLATVESCTGGLLSHWVTNVSGSSEALWGAWVVYDNGAKIGLLDAAETIAPLIRAHGAVSAEVARALAEAGARKLAGAIGSGKTLCIATTGIAGPTGGSSEKPVGLCHVAVSLFTPQGLSTRAEEVRGDRVGRKLERVQMKEYFAERALALAVACLMGPG